MNRAGGRDRLKGSWSRSPLASLPEVARSSAESCLLSSKAEAPLSFNMASRTEAPARAQVILPAADAYIFDIDGTLLVTKDLVHWNALRQAMLEAYGVDTTIEGIAYHGMTDLSILRAALVRKGICNADFERGLPQALSVVCREVDAHRESIVTAVCGGVVKLLEELRGRNRLLGIASGNLEAVGWHKLEAAGLRELFSFGCFSDGCEERRAIFHNALQRVAQRLGRKARSCFIGDTPSDIAAARAVGASIVAVSSGTFSFAELNSCSPDLCVSGCDQFVSC